MQIIVCENYDQMSFQGAEIIKSILLHNPSAVLGLATGSTPIGMYGLLAEACARGEISFAAARIGSAVARVIRAGIPIGDKS